MRSIRLCDQNLNSCFALHYSTSRNQLFCLFPERILVWDPESGNKVKEYSVEWDLSNSECAILCVVDTHPNNEDEMAFILTNYPMKHIIWRKRSSTTNVTLRDALRLPG